MATGERDNPPVWRLHVRRVAETSGDRSPTENCIQNRGFPASVAACARHCEDVQPPGPCSVTVVTPASRGRNRLAVSRPLLPGEAHNVCKVRLVQGTHGQTAVTPPVSSEHATRSRPPLRDAPKFPCSASCALRTTCRALYVRPTRRRTRRAGRAQSCSVMACFGHARTAASTLSRSDSSGFSCSTSRVSSS